MIFPFVPHKLQQVRESVVDRHQKSDIKNIRDMDEQMRALIPELVSLDDRRINIRAFALSDRDVMMIALYIPHNYYDVDMKNLFRVFSLRSNEGLCRVLYEEWQNSYQNDACNKFIRTSLDSNSDFQSFVGKVHMTIQLYASIIDSDNIPVKYLHEVMARAMLSGKSVDEQLSYYGLQRGTLLYNSCAFNYYLYCSKRDYLAVSQTDLLAIIKQYKMRDHKLLNDFVNNFLLRLEMRELQEFKEIAQYLSTVIGGGGSKSVQEDEFFGKYPLEITRKYLDWIHLFEIQESFGLDNRSEFWRQYRFVSVKKYSRSNTVLMEFRNHYAVEFLGKGMGPIYLFNKEYFDNNLIYRMDQYDNIQMRLELFHNTDKKERYRREHIGFWRKDVHRYLMKNHITELIGL